MLGIVDLCWLGFVGKVRPAGLEGKAGLHTVGSTGQTRFPDIRDELLSSIHNKIKKTDSSLKLIWSCSLLLEHDVVREDITL